MIEQQLSNIFRTIEADLGTSRLLNLVLEVIIKSAEDFKSSEVESFFKQMKELLLFVKSTKPRIGIVIYYLYEIWDQLDEQKASLKTMDELRGALKKIVQTIIKEVENEMEQLITYGVKCIEENDSILIHSHSHTVLRIIETAWNKQKKFRIILAEQEEEKTHDMIAFLHKREIPFYVVPEFMLSHIENEVTKVFLGGLTLNHNFNFVADAGTRAVVSEFHHEHIPIYMFLVTKKFSLWENPTQHHTYKVVQKKIKKNGKLSLDYEKIKFSHDRVPLNNLDHVITEKGIFTPKETEKIYQEMFEERVAWRKKHFCEEC